ncbi:MAG: tryptophan synthase subunit alpha [Planctomycetota bacterium]
MSRIDAIFERLRGEGLKALMPFVTAGDPSMAATAEVLLALEGSGASVVELGIPFSDPIADGPVIQASMQHALDEGATVEGVFEMVASVRDRLSLGLVAMVSYSIVHRLGLEAFVERAAGAGFDGLIFPDLSLEEAEASGGAREVAKGAGLSLAMLVAPTTPIERAERIAAASSGFVYVVSRAGITGARTELPAGLSERLERLRGVTETPLAVGFGVSTAEQVGAVVGGAGGADAVIVGSALVERIAATRGEAASVSAGVAGEFVKGLAAGLED